MEDLRGVVADVAAFHAGRGVEAEIAQNSAGDVAHLVRAFGQIGLGSRWTVFGTVEGMTGAPVTPVSQVVIRRPCGCAFYRFGEENSVTGPGTLRLDLGANLAFRGPWKSRMWFGVSVINFGWGAVAPVIPSEPARAPAAYERLFNLPAVPTLTLRVVF
jgi:hypothetical protein